MTLARAPGRGPVVVGVLTGALVVACSGTDQPNGHMIFDRSVRQAYVQVRACRSPGEHSGINAFTVWVSKDAESAFQSIWQTPPAIQRLPNRALVVKEVYSSTDCNPTAVVRWVAMQKEKGFDPANADWHWQEVTVDGNVTSDGADARCIDCHRGGDTTTCIGYGEQNGRDYLCTQP